MTSPRKVHVRIDRLVVDGPVDERALRAAIAAELGGQDAPDVGQRARSSPITGAAAREVARQVRGVLPVEPGRARR